MLKLIIIQSSLLFSALSFATTESESCNYPCLSVPSIEESYIEFGSPESQVLPSQNLNILVWNIYKGKESLFEKEFQKLITNKHLLILQEVILDKKMTDIFNSLSGYLFSDAVSFMHQSQSPAGVATGSKAMYLSAQIKRTVDREPFINTPKTIMINTYQLDDGKSLLVLNIHGINVSGAKTLERQLKQTESIIKNHVGPVVFAGDFNTHIQDRKTMTDNFFAQLKMTKATLKNDNRTKVLDHLYYRELSIQSAELISDLQGSDHPAIEATVSAL